ncbi:hypothetical protein BVRB_8g183370 [Beta vulgaris subsp. vulgaris]|nr:hypothetical protein BVRB_8g183370 [Beta vulgaris subsp. vulgaris]
MQGDRIICGDFFSGHLSPFSSPSGSRRLGCGCVVACSMFIIVRDEIFLHFNWCLENPVSQGQHYGLSRQVIEAMMVWLHHFE